MAINSGTSATKIHGASLLCAAFWLGVLVDQQGPAERRDAEHSRQTEQERRSVAKPDGRARVAPRAALERRSYRNRLPARVRLRPSVSHSSGARTLAIWGAKTGE